MWSSKLKTGLCFIGLVLIVWWYFYFQLFVFTYLSTISCWQISNSWMASQETDSHHSWPDSLCMDDQYKLTGTRSLAFVVYSSHSWQLVVVSGFQKWPPQVFCRLCVAQYTSVSPAIASSSAMSRSVAWTIWQWHLTMTRRDKGHLKF